MSSDVSTLLDQLGVEALLRVVDFMTKKEAPRSAVGLRV